MFEFNCFFSLVEIVNGTHAVNFRT